jgi:hypothetical protein
MAKKRFSSHRQVMKSLRVGMVREWYGVDIVFVEAL